jgi:hypothetical protein
VEKHSQEEINQAESSKQGYGPKWGCFADDGEATCIKHIKYSNNDVTVDNTSFRYELISCIFGALLTKALLWVEPGFDVDCDEFGFAMLPSPADRYTES